MVINRLKFGNLHFFIILIVLIGLSSCAGVDKTLIEDSSLRVSPKPLILKTKPEVYLLRADLVRNTQTVDDDHENFQKEDMNYHFVGVSFGNGLFLDYNQNLSVDLIEFFDLDDKSFSITEKKAGIVGNQTKYVRDGESFTLTRNSLAPWKMRTSIKENEINIALGVFRTGIDITWEKNELIFKALGVVNVPDSTILVQKDEDHVFIGNWFTKDEFVRSSDSNITLGKYLTIERMTDEIVFDYKGFCGIRQKFIYIILENGFIFYDSQFRGIEVTKNGNKIISRKNGQVVSVVEL